MFFCTSTLAKRACARLNAPSSCSFSTTLSSPAGRRNLVFRSIRPVMMGCALFTASMQQVLDAALFDRDVERDVTALHVLRADHGALRLEQRLADLRVNAFEPRVAVGAVDDRVELRHQVDRRACQVDPEIRDVGRAFDFDPFERTAVPPFRREGAGNALDGVEVGVLERVVCPRLASDADRRAARDRTSRSCRCGRPAWDWSATR